MQVGEDDWGAKYIDNLQSFGVNTQYVRRVKGKATGMAQINVAENGDNQIVIIPGANDTIVQADIEECACDVLDKSKVLLYFHLLRLINEIFQVDLEKNKIKLKLKLNQQ